MHKLELTLACGRYDRTQPLIDGRVQPDGVDLTFIPLRPGDTFWRMLNHGEFDVSEMSLSSYTILRSEGDTCGKPTSTFPENANRSSQAGAPRCRPGSPPCPVRSTWWCPRRGPPDAPPTGSDGRCRARFGSPLPAPRGGEAPRAWKPGSRNRVG